MQGSGDRTKYGDADCPQKVFNMAKTVPGKDPKLYRQDVYGTVIYFHSRGNGPMSWHVDHIIAVNKGGSDFINNL